MTRSHCVVHLQRLGDRTGEEAFEFVLGETHGHRRPLPASLEPAVAARGSPWSPPAFADSVTVARWVTEGVLALGSSKSAEFEPVCQDSDDAGGLLGRCRLTLLETRPAQDLLGDGGVVLCFLDLPEDEGQAKPRDLARVTASWQVWFARNSELLLSIGTLAEGQVKGREFTVDDSGLMPALEMGFKELRSGSRAFLRVSEEWAVGSLAPEGNPSLRGAAIWAELVLHSVTNEPGPGEHASAAAALEFALAKKQQGNAGLAGGTGADIGRACRRYEAGIAALEAVFPEARGKRRSSSSTAPVPVGPLASEEERPGIEEALRALRLNTAQAELKRCRWKEAADLCSLVLETAEGNGKAHFRRGLARAELGDLSGAVEDLRRAIAANPSDAAGRRELARVEAERKEKKAEEKSTFGGLFDKMRQKDEEREQREEARRKAEEEQEARRKKEEAEKKREEARANTKERRKQQVEEDAKAKEAAATAPASEVSQAAGSPESAAQAPAPPKATEPAVPAPPAEEAREDALVASAAPASDVAVAEAPARKDALAASAAPASDAAMAEAPVPAASTEAVALAASAAAAPGPTATPARAEQGEPAEAAAHTDAQLLDSLRKEEESRGGGDRGGPGTILPMMPPNDMPFRKVDKAPPVQYEVPAFLRRKKGSKA